MGGRALDVRADAGRVWTLANVVTASRILLTLPVALLILGAGGAPSPAALALFLLAAATDAADGYLARARRESSALGVALDPVADKVFGIAVFGALVRVGALPAWMLGVLVAKELALLVGGAVLLGGEKKVVPARFMGKAATVLLFGGFAVLIAGLGTAGYWVCAAAVACSLAAGVDYALVYVRLRRGARGTGHA